MREGLVDYNHLPAFYEGGLKDRCEPEIWCALILGRSGPHEVLESLKKPSSLVWSGNLFDRRVTALF